MVAIVAAMTVWYIPGWLRTHTPQDGVLETLAEIFPEAKVEFREWDGDRIDWSKSVANADAAVEGFVREIAALPEAERDGLVLVGHSLGGRIAARVMARLDERGLKVRQGVLAGAAIPYADPDLERIGGGSRLPVLAICNPDDVTLKYVYATVGGEASAAYGANGSVRPLGNVREYVVPASITKETPIDAKWAEVQIAKDVANHHALFYLAALKKVTTGEELERRVMVPQDYPTVEWPVIDGGIWWDTLEEANGWKLQRNKVTGHARILDPGKVRKAWGTLDKLRPAFEKVKEGGRGN